MEKGMVKYEVGDTELETIDQIDMKELLALTGLDTLKAGDISLPVLAIRQFMGTWGDESQIGKVVNRLTNQAYDQIEAVPIWVRRTRIMWQQPYNNNRVPLCASDNGTMPRVDRVEDRKTGPCGPTCPFAQWGDDKDEHAVPPCSETWNILFYLPEQNEVALARFARTSLKAGDGLVSFFMQHALKTSVTLSTVKVSKDGKTWYQWIFTGANELAKAQQVEIYKQLKAMQPMLSVMTAEMGDVELAGEANGVASDDSLTPDDFEGAPGADDLAF